MKEKIGKGHLHPISIMMADIAIIFRKMGFAVALGPEIEEEYYNFDALNVPAWHPARDMQDTFWLKPLSDHKLLRTHTSPIQIRYMNDNKPPIRIVALGQAFRNEATDVTHEAQFHQVEALMVDENVSLANLKGVLEKFFSELFGVKIVSRLRPSYFPFVEPGAEIDISCFKCFGKGCNVCKNTGWIEVMGCGTVHPKVLESGGVNPRKYKGFAFGGGIDRLVMLKYGIDDIRLLYQGDLRLVNQF
ncbi:MAG: phenylalanine--tRNA ligase subunit alpha [bacterium]|nr:phenylalanine--tRNA ligase subunit alpha [bacterium]